MNEFTLFLQTYGWQLTIIAAVGIIILGALKYANAFSKIEKEKRKPIYFAISIGFSIIASIIYLLVVHQFTFEYVIGVTTAIYALNQAMYAVYEQTTLRDLLQKYLRKLLDWVIAKLKKPSANNN